MSIFSLSKKWRVMMRHTKNGVKFIDPSNVYIEENVEIGSGTVIYPNVYLYNGTRIGRDCRVWPENHIFSSDVGDECILWPSISLLSSKLGNGVEVHRGSRIVNTRVEEGAAIESNAFVKNAWIGKRTFVDTGSVVRYSQVGNDCTIGPKAIVEQNAWISSDVKIGAQAHVQDFSWICPRVEIAHAQVVRSIILPDTKVKHFGYIGDAIVGNECNIGAGTVFCNYDGSSKRQVKLKDNVFVGSGSMLIAPLEIGEESYIAAGSVVPADSNIPPNSLVIARGQRHTHNCAAGSMNSDEGVAVKEGYSHRKRGRWNIGKPAR